MTNRGCGAVIVLLVLGLALLIAIWLGMSLSTMSTKTVGTAFVMLVAGTAAVLYAVIGRSPKK